MRVLVTGSSGLIGTNRSLRLLEEGHEVRGLDLRENTWTDRIPLLRWDLLRPVADLLEALRHENAQERLLTCETGGALWRTLVSLTRQPKRSKQTVGAASGPRNACETHAKRMDGSPRSSKLDRAGLLPRKTDRERP